MHYAQTRFGFAYKSHEQAGLTLLELLITLSIASILITAAIPSLTQIYRSYALTTQANEMLMMVNFSRSTSITRNASIRLCRANSEITNTCALSSSDWKHWLILSDKGDVLRRGMLPDNKGLTQTLNITNDMITFGADGLARSNGDLINGKRFAIQVTADPSSESRCLTFGAGSRSSITKTTGNCTA
ncbi:GspH/FimT family pseudopilin [Thiothrix lacustris]|uniref:Type II secretion system protein H n=1 Tax=Thiothrix lacustris TaxID=525917 RepID=A0ABY9MS93_9GAMM|nr:GspH/FimT family pseudopilin [Thiothrix lacustris]WML91071.1 GspH/FimT family pseudopilin [Thiothrix lacustris]WMP17039.1 GspH/FimT family pseudopilin [Thiothrix lacustris]